LTDINKIALVISIAALVLALPLGIVGNILTPKLRDWYSTTSQKRLRARIATLSAQLAKSEQQWTFTEAEWAQFKTNAIAIVIFCLLAICVFCVTVVITALISTLGDRLFALLDKNRPPRIHGFLSVFALTIFSFIGYSLSVAFVFYLKNASSTHLLMHTTEGREKLKKQIAQLTAKLK
jgi:predicted PurR-regulated permease PerM